MRTRVTVFVSVVAFFGAAPLAAQSDDACPVTTTEDPLAGAALPGWYGTESLAVQFSGGAMIWPTTKPGALLAGRLEWRSSGFIPSPESHLKVQIKNLRGGPVTARISGAQSASIPLVQPGRQLTHSEADALAREAEVSTERWRMLTGVDFPEPGCWEISADYLGNRLTFVIESVPIDKYRALVSR
jgi:hypothetical protein